MAPGTFSSTHGRNAVDNGEINRPRCANINNDPRHTIGGIFRGDILLEPRQLDFLEIGWVMQWTASGRCVLIARVVTVKGVRRQSEEILHRERYAGRNVILEFAQ